MLFDIKLFEGLLMNYNDFDYGVRIRQAALENNPSEIERVVQQASDNNISAECLRTYVRSPRLHARPQLVFLALRNAIEKNFPQCVEQLIAIAAPSEVNEALQLAANLGHTQCVRLLIPLADPKDRNSKALAQAVLNGHTECVDLLFDVSDPEVVLAHWSGYGYPDPKKWDHLKDKIQQQDPIQTVSSETNGVKPLKI